MPTSSRIYKSYNHLRASWFLGIYGDKSIFRYDYHEELFIKQYGEPLELPKTLKESIREGLHEQGNFNDY